MEVCCTNCFITQVLSLVSISYLSWFSPSCYLPSSDGLQCVLFPSMCLCGLIIYLPLISENMWDFVFCSCISLLRIVASSSIHFPAKGRDLVLLSGCIVFHDVYVPHFLYPFYNWWAFMLIQIFLPLWIVLQWTFVYMCPYNRTIYSLLDIYPVMGLLGQMEFLFLRPWGIATLSSTITFLYGIGLNLLKFPKAGLHLCS